MGGIKPVADAVRIYEYLEENPDPNWSVVSDELEFSIGGRASQTLLSKKCIRNDWIWNIHPYDAVEICSIKGKPIWFYIEKCCDLAIFQTSENPYWVKDEACFETEGEQLLAIVPRHQSRDDPPNWSRCLSADLRTFVFGIPIHQRKQSL